MVVSALAALQGSPELALGNAYGSNIMNIALGLGITALISPIVIRSSIVKRDLPLLLLITLLAARQLSQTDDILLLLGLLALLTFQIIVVLREGSNKKESSDNIDNSKAETAGLSCGLASLVIGMSILVLSSHAIVWGAVELATYWGLSEFIIGLTIVAAIRLFALLTISNHPP